MSNATNKATETIKIELVHRSDSGRWVAVPWGKSSPIPRPVPGNRRPAGGAQWNSVDAAIAELPSLIGFPIQVVMVDGARVAPNPSVEDVDSVCEACSVGAMSPLHAARAAVLCFLSAR